MFRVSEVFRCALACWLCVSLLVPAWAQGTCHKPVYLTFDTGHMGVAPLVAEVLKREQIRVTFFAANETTQEGDGSLGEHWAPWWRARVAEGHELASHTYDHVYWRGDVAGTPPRFRMRPEFGPDKGVESVWSAEQYCAAIDKSAIRLESITGVPVLPLFRAPGGKTSPKLLGAAEACGWKHVGWAPAGFLGDELSSDRYSNTRLLQQALHNIRPGDILMAHLGIWSRQAPWAPAVLEPLVQGLKAHGFCFETLSHHPDYVAWVQTHRRLVHR